MSQANHDAVERPRKRTADEIAQHLRRFLEGSGGEWDWDDFTSIPLDDPSLESIRARAASVELPLSEEGRHTLLALLVEVETQCKSEARLGVAKGAFKTPEPNKALDAAIEKTFVKPKK